MCGRYTKRHKESVDDSHKRCLFTRYLRKKIKKIQILKAITGFFVYSKNIFSNRKKLKRFFVCFSKEIDFLVLTKFANLESMINNYKTTIFINFEQNSFRKSNFLAKIFTIYKKRDAYSNVF